ncbi:MAG: DUF4154 domain-containing protein, partial [Sinobacterium sp.]|nr:DUF4154 domain-containing protein [Sinobacterium sp.]
MAASVRAADRQLLAQDEAKAVLLYNFIKHTEWRHTEKPVIEVGFLGVDDRVVEKFKRIANEAGVHGRSISPQILRNYSNAGRLEVLVLGAKYNRRLAEIAASIARTQTLIVSDDASNNTSSMINFIYPKADKISFEVNQSNLEFEGLKVSKDILLYGGSEIEIADLYKQMEEALVLVKAKLRQQETVLFEQRKTVSKQADQIHNHYDLMTKKNRLIFEQTEHLSQLSLELQIVDNDLNKSLFLLANSEKEIVTAQKNLASSKLLALDLEKNIRVNSATLKAQGVEISTQSKQLKQQSSVLINQEGTIESQRNIILVAFILLFFTTALIIYRQKRALDSEHDLLEKEEALVEAQKKSIDAYEMSLRVKNDFITAINHELKTPMHIINSALYNISKGDEVDCNLNFLEHGSQQMSQLIEDMLMYSALLSDDAKPHITCAPMRKEILQVADLFRERAAAQSIELHCEISESLPAFILVDVVKLRRVLEKVLCNACKFTEAGMIDVSVRCETGDFTQLIIKVSDTGIGISPEALHSIYSPFVQREAGLSRRYEGLGIGLSICKSVMTLLGGNIDITSIEGEGTDVLISLPIQMPVASQMPDTALVHNDLFSGTSDKIVLLVEDNDISRMVMEKLLNGLGYSCVSVASGADALSTLEKRHIDIVVMDIQMPEMDGIECTKILR